LNNDQIVVGFVVVVVDVVDSAVVIIATHTAAVQWLLRNKNCLLRGELAV
jgi:hypothetical protein